MFTTTVFTIVFLPLILKFSHLIDKIDFPARMMMGALFLLAGLGKLDAHSQTLEYMIAHGLPGILYYPTIGFEIMFGALLIVGFKTRFVAFALAGFTLLSATIFHLDFGDQSQLTNFLKNLAIAGGLLMVAKHGSEHLSVDRYLKPSQKTRLSETGGSEL